MLSIDGKTIEDPVPRHDVSMCAVYLCPDVAQQLKVYLADGCENSFQEFIRANRAQKK